MSDLVPDHDDVEEVLTALRELAAVVGSPAFRACLEEALRDTAFLTCHDEWLDEDRGQRAVA